MMDHPSGLLAHHLIRWLNFSRVLTTGDADVVSVATDLINELGRHGHHSYRSLIKGGGTS